MFQSKALELHYLWYENYFTATSTQIFATRARRLVATAQKSALKTLLRAVPAFTETSWLIYHRRGLVQALEVDNNSKSLSVLVGVR